jgi:ribose transport system substrate-binding protein
MKKTTMLFLSCALLISGWPAQMLSQGESKIAVVPKSNTVLFWKSIHAGAKLAAVASAGTQILWRTPVNENDKAQQIAIVEQCISEGVSGIVLSPLDNKALAVPVANAAKKNIPVVIFDSGLEGTPGKDYVCFVRIDNKKAGSLAGEQMVKLLGGKGRVVLLRYRTGPSNIMDRELGFLEVMARHQGIRIIEKDRYASSTVDDAMNISLEMAERLNQADGIFCSYEQTTLGMLRALQKLHLAGRVHFVGFDTPGPAVDALKEGQVSALVAQDPARMGYLSVKAMVDYLRGEKVAPIIDTDVQIVTRENLSSAEVQKILAVPSITE